ncbi:MAG: hypothetical protein GX772_11850 [Alcaligenaceae bacterium]|nr:hypothetical protein [Alcaligenaceae bacterium]
MALLSKTQRPDWLWVLTITTAVYLVIEFAFNARLLDVVGGMPNNEQLSDIEEYGRRISGFAVALLFWGKIFEWHRSKSTGRVIWGRALVSIAISTFVVVHVVYYLEGRLVDSLVEQSSPEVRAASVSSVVMQKTLASGRLKMNGLDLDASRLTDPDGKAFLALYAPLTSYLPGLGARLSDNHRVLARHFIYAVAEADAASSGHTGIKRPTKAEEDQVVRLLQAPAAAFADGKQVAEEGKRYTRTMLVPSIALSFSIMGALVHIWKLFFFSLHLATGRAVQPSWAKGLAITALSLAALFVFTKLPTTDITGQRLYVHLKQEMVDSAPDGGDVSFRRMLGFFADAVIHSQPVMYPVFEWTRVYLLGGFQFGYGQD